VRNGAETDTDCGGSCPACANGRTCATAADCTSGVCVSTACVPPEKPCVGAFAGCSSFTDLTAPTADRTIRLNGESFSPKCIRIKVGQSVKYTGSFGDHPVRQSCGPTTVISGLGGGGNSTVTFSNAVGTYGYYCTAHGTASGGSMAGAIQVAP
jgi:plastocyanin